MMRVGADYRCHSGSAECKPRLGYIRIQLEDSIEPGEA